MLWTVSASRVYAKLVPKPDIIDADFEIVSGPYRVGDPHPTKKRWLWTGRYDEKGRPLWYRPPLFNRYQFAGVIFLGMIAFWVALFIVAWAWSLLPISGR